MRVTEFRRKTFSPGDWGPTIDYIFSPKKLELTVFSNQVLSLETAELEMRAIAATNSRVSKPLVHMAISWSPQDQPNCDQMVEALTAVLGTLDLLEHQWMAGLHGDNSHPHLHFVANRVHPEFATVAPLHHSMLILKPVLRFFEERYSLVPGGPPSIAMNASAASARHWTGIPSGLVGFYRARSENDGKLRIAPKRLEAVASSIDSVLMNQASSFRDLSRVLRAANVRLNVEDNEAIVVDLSSPVHRASLTKYGITGAQIPERFVVWNVEAALSPSLFEDMRVRFKDERALIARQSDEDATGRIRIRESEKYVALRLERKKALDKARMTSDGFLRRSRLALVELEFSDRQKALKCAIRQERERELCCTRPSTDIYDWQQWLTKQEAAGDEDAAIILIAIRRREALLPSDGDGVVPQVIVRTDDRTKVAYGQPYVRGTKTQRRSRVAETNQTTHRQSSLGSDHGVRVDQSVEPGPASANAPSISPRSVVADHLQIEQRSAILKRASRLQAHYDITPRKLTISQVNFNYQTHLNDLCSLKGVNAGLAANAPELLKTKGFDVKIAGRLLLTGHNAVDIVRSVETNVKALSAQKRLGYLTNQIDQAYEILRAATSWLKYQLTGAEQRLRTIWLELECHVIRAVVEKKIECQVGALNKIGVDNTDFASREVGVNARPPTRKNVLLDNATPDHRHGESIPSASKALTVERGSVEEVGNLDGLDRAAADLEHVAGQGEEGAGSRQMLGVDASILETPTAKLLVLDAALSDLAVQKSTPRFVMELPVEVANAPPDADRTVAPEALAPLPFSEIIAHSRSSGRVVLFKPAPTEATSPEAPISMIPASLAVEAPVERAASTNEIEPTFAIKVSHIIDATGEQPTPALVMKSSIVASEGASLNAEGLVDVERQGLSLTLDEMASLQIVLGQVGSLLPKPIKSTVEPTMPLPVVTDRLFAVVKSVPAIEASNEPPMSTADGIGMPTAVVEATPEIKATTEPKPLIPILKSASLDEATVPTPTVPVVVTPPRLVEASIPLVPTPIASTSTMSPAPTLRTPKSDSFERARVVDDLMEWAERRATDEPIVSIATDAYRAMQRKLLAIRGFDIGTIYLESLSIPTLEKRLAAVVDRKRLDRQPSSEAAGSEWAKEVAAIVRMVMSEAKMCAQEMSRVAAKTRREDARASRKKTVRARGNDQLGL